MSLNPGSAGVFFYVGAQEGTTMVDVIWILVALLLIYFLFFRGAA